MATLGSNPRRVSSTVCRLCGTGDETGHDLHEDSHASCVEYAHWQNEGARKAAEKEHERKMRRARLLAPVRYLCFLLVEVSPFVLAAGVLLAIGVVSPRVAAEFAELMVGVLTLDLDDPSVWVEQGTGAAQ